MEDRRGTLPRDLTAQALAFDPVLPPAGVPEALARDGSGGWILQVLAPEARQVRLSTTRGEFAFARGEDGVWRLRWPGGEGFQYVHLLLDGADVLSPWLPIGYGYARPCNFVEIPERDSDWYRLRDVPHGKLLRDWYFSSVTGEWESCSVWLPPTYDREPERVFPVLYLQHGHGENEVGWSTAGKLPFILDNLLAEGACAPFGVVMCNGMVQRMEGDRRLVDFRLFDALLRRDVIPFAEGRYRLGGDRSRRAVAGLSMGSVQASVSAMTHPELFCALGVFSGFLHDVLSGSELDMVSRGPSAQEHLALMEDRERLTA